jgi:hypothetical protein
MQDLISMCNVRNRMVPLMILLFTVMSLLQIVLILSCVHCISLVATECLLFSYVYRL